MEDDQPGQSEDRERLSPSAAGASEPDHSLSGSNGEDPGTPVGQGPPPVVDPWPVRIIVSAAVATVVLSTGLLLLHPDVRDALGSGVGWLAGTRHGAAAAAGQPRTVLDPGPVREAGADPVGSPPPPATPSASPPATPAMATPVPTRRSRATPVPATSGPPPAPAPTPTPTPTQSPTSTPEPSPSDSPTPTPSPTDSADPTPPPTPTPSGYASTAGSDRGD